MVPIRIDSVLVNIRGILHKFGGLLANNRADAHHQGGNGTGKTGENHDHTDVALNAPGLQATHNRVQTQRNENSAGHPAHQGTHVIEDVVGQQGQTHTDGHEEAERDGVVHHGGLAVAEDLRRRGSIVASRRHHG